MHGVNLQRNWISYETIYTNVDMKNSVIAVHLQWQRIEEVRASLSATEIHFLKRVSFFEENYQKMFKLFRRHSVVPKNKKWRILISLSQNKELRIKPFFTIFALKPESKYDSRSAKLATIFYRNEQAHFIVIIVVHICGMI